MQRYAEALSALNTALNLMIEEGDTLMLAAISHPLHLAESQLTLRRAETLMARMPEYAIMTDAGGSTEARP